MRFIFSAVFIVVSVFPRLSEAQDLPLRWDIALGASQGNSTAPLSILGQTRTLVGLDDLNGDGIGDFAVYTETPLGFQVRCTKTGSLLHDHIVIGPSAPSQTTCGELFVVSDVDQDGYRDLGIAFGSQFDVFSSVTGARLSTAAPASFQVPMVQLSEVQGALGIGDQNQDGVGEILLICSGLFDFAVLVFDPISETPISVVDSGEWGVFLIYSLFCQIRAYEVGDIDSDGTTDFCINGWFYSECVIPSATCDDILGIEDFRIYSGADMSILSIFPQQFSPPTRGFIKGSLGDRNGDGIDELLFHESVGSALQHRVLDPFLGLTGAAVLLAGQAPDTIASIDIGDVDGDHIDDTCFQMRGDNAAPLGFSGATRLREDGWFPPTVPLRIGGILGVGDVSGDGLSDILINADGRIMLYSPMGADVYGESGQSMSIEWKLQSTATAGEGTLAVRGGTPNGSGLSGVSLAAGSAMVGDIELLIDLSMTQDHQVFPMAFDAFGNYRSYFSIRQPALAGTSLYFQTIDVSDPLDPLATPGLEVRFGN